MKHHFSFSITQSNNLIIVTFSQSLLSINHYFQPVNQSLFQSIIAFYQSIITFNQSLHTITHYIQSINNNIHTSLLSINHYSDNHSLLSVNRCSNNRDKYMDILTLCRVCSYLTLIHMIILQIDYR